MKYHVKCKVEDQRDSKQTSRVQLNNKRDERLVIAFLFSRCLYFLVVVSIKHIHEPQRFSDESREDNRFDIHVWLLYMSTREKMEVRSYRSSRPLWGKFFS